MFSLFVLYFNIGFCYVMLSKFFVVGWVFFSQILTSSLRSCPILFGSAQISTKFDPECFLFYVLALIRFTSVLIATHNTNF